MIERNPSPGTLPMGQSSSEEMLQLEHALLGLLPDPPATKHGLTAEQLRQKGSFDHHARTITRHLKTLARHGVAEVDSSQKAHRWSL